MKTLHPAALRQGADYQRTLHHIDVQADPEMTITDVMRPGFWKHHSDRIRPGDQIDVIGSGFDITLRVTEKGLGYVNTRLLRLWQDEEPAEKPADVIGDVPEGYTVDHTPKTLWRVRMKPEGTELSRNHKTKADAIGAAQAHHAKAMGVSVAA